MFETKIGYTQQIIWTTSNKKKINDIKSKIAKEQELRRRLQTLFKNKPSKDTEANKWNQEASKSSPIKNNVNNSPKQKFNKLNTEAQVKRNGNVQKQKKNYRSKKGTSSRVSARKVNGVGKKATKSQKDKKMNFYTNSADKNQKTSKNNAQHKFPNQKTKQTTQKRKGDASKYTPSKKQKINQNEELPPDVLHIDSSEFSFSDFSDVNEEADSDAGTYSTDDNFTGSEYSFSNFQDEIAAAPNGFVGGGNFDSYNDNDFEDRSNMYGGEHCFGDDHRWEHDDDTYSDFDEGDYEEEEDSFDYAEDMDDNDFYSSATDDEDYHLPEHVPEDLIVHRGTADKRDLYTSDEVVFSENSEGVQLIELRHQVCIKSIQQPSEYHRSALEELNKKKINIPPPPTEQETVEESECDNDCPKLVPIVDKDGFQLYSEELNSMDSCESFDISSYEECSDQDGSIVSIDVNSKYLQDSEEELNASTDDDEEKSHQKIKKRMSAEVIEAALVQVDFEKHFNEEHKNDTETNELDVLPSERLATKLKKAKCGKGTVIQTKINAIKSKVIVQPDESTKSPVEPQLKNDIAVTSLPTNPVENTLRSETIKTPEIETTTPGQIDSKLPPVSVKIPEISHKPSLGSCRSIFCNAIDSNYVLVLLREPLCIYGTIKLIPIAGSIEIYGYSPKRGEELEIYSTRGMSSVQIVPKLSDQTTLKAVTKELLKLEANFSKVELNKIKENFDLIKDALILLKRNEPRKKLISTFKKYMSENIFPNMNSIQLDRPFYASECRLRCIISATDECDKPLKINAQWEQLQLQSNSKIMLIGGKSVGKSTLLRYLVNHHLAQHPRMLVIDLDIGQPELFVPQTISASLVEQPLLGPGFFLNEQPLQAFAIGHSNIVLCPHLYMQAVKQLINFCTTQIELTQLPWLINTMGYNKGFGAELVAVLCELLQPTDVVQLQSNKDINNYDYLMEPNVLAEIPRNIYSDKEYQTARIDEQGSVHLTYKLHVFNSAVMQESRYQRDWEMSSKDMRYANMLSRLSETLVGHADWLSDCKPLCASLDNLKLLNLLSSGFTREQILKSIEANLVYLCRQEDNECPVHCFGIGVVRAIDYHVNQIYLIPALPQHLMAEVNCLAIGEMPLPTSMLTNQGTKVKNTAPFLYNTVDANASKSIKQIFYRPSEFLSGKHRNVI